MNELLPLSIGIGLAVSLMFSELFGLAAGDNICRVLAGNAGLPNANTYRAWLSTASTDAYCHVQGQTGKRATGCVGTAVPAGPWYRYDGIGRFTGTVDELVGEEPQIYQPIRYDDVALVEGQTILKLRRAQDALSA